MDEEKKEKKGMERAKKKIREGKEKAKHELIYNYISSRLNALIFF